jgi:hypothetical protein
MDGQGLDLVAWASAKLMLEKNMVAQNLTGDISNAGEPAIDLSFPYRVAVEIEGIAPILFHRWQSDEVETKAAAAKNSKTKKTDNVESYVYRGPTGNIVIPGIYLVGSLTNPQNGAAKYQQDPRSPRKSALDLYKAAIQPISDGDLGVKDWDFLDRRRAVVQRQGITRVRPGMAQGWKATFDILCTMSEYVSPSDLHSALNLAGRAVGIGDFRPTFGRFLVRSFQVIQD